MRRRLITRALTLSVATALVGCTSWPVSRSQSQGFHAPLSDALAAQLAADAYGQITAHYPPAQTVLLLPQETTDPFGIALADQLRTAGYGVQQGSQVTPVVTATVPNAKPLTYLVAAMSQSEYRVTVMVDSTQFNRAYVSLPDGLHAASLWTQRGRDERQ